MHECILVWSLAGRGETSPLEVEVRSGPKGLWAKLDDQASTGHSCLLGVARPSRGACVGCKAGATRRGWHTSDSQVVAGWTQLNAKDLVGLAHVIGMDPAALDGLGHVVSGLGLYSVQAGGQWDTSCEGKPEKLSSVMQCGERPSSPARVAHHSR